VSRAFSSELQNKIRGLAALYPSKQAALLPVLHLVQNERGSIAPEDERSVAEVIGIKPIKVREVVTFYTMFNRRPVGKYHVQVCSNLSCSLAGGERIVDYLKVKLGVRLGDTTSDGRFTLTEVECLGACEAAPCMMVNFDYYLNLDRDTVDRIFERLP